ncbi:MAG TPA: phosphoribosylformylglycinamidine synthase [Chitinispirillaceae bacterium]|nr:phosphoribosylformylglycinamidine synthase [Chitinispirillaceae bacterium]
MGDVRSIFVEKKSGFDVVAQGLLADLRDNLKIRGLVHVRVLIRYDLEGISDSEYQASRTTIFAEPPVDLVYDEKIPSQDGDRMFAVEYLPGQYDQRADSAAQCIQLITHGNRPLVATAQIFILQGTITDEEFLRIKRYCINPVDSREASIKKPQTLQMQADVPEDVKNLENFCSMDSSQLVKLRAEFGLAMRFEDLEFCQKYFRDTEHRDPTITEIRMIDTYWSDHCRHTTFLAKINKVQIEPGKFSEPLSKAFSSYQDARSFVYGLNKKDISLMDIATIGMKELRKRGLLNNLDVSEEINACSITVPVTIDGKTEDWLIMFKNETHNHPTEIEPFGGAATCLGGAIRDPLSGRSYVYQAMRVTGSGDPRKNVEQTLPGKLPQRKITTLAAYGYSSYGNQIGLATGHVAEIYDEGYVAKRMEIGAVIGAAPKANVIREIPAPQDIVLLIGGRTGRDGCGGATGSSKEHTEESINTCSAEVQKGNPPTERKLQRLFRNPEVSRMIKRCNDFGAGGVSVAIGELAPGLIIDLDAVPRKYEGLDGTELAISESQERMAVVIARSDREKFESFAAMENLETAAVAIVTAEKRLKMIWRGKVIVDLSRDFLDTNGTRMETEVLAKAPDQDNNFFHKTLIDTNCSGDLRQSWFDTISDLNVCSQKGLVERFDSTIGAGSVLLPFGGKYQSTPSECMVARLPVTKGYTISGTAMSHGYNPKLSRWSPFHGAIYAVIEAVAKIVAAGGDHHQIRLTLQEYFERVGTDPVRWGKPFSALLGALTAQQKLGIAAIGGKDSMSGTFKDMHVPPTLVAFALAPVDVSKVISPEFKKAGSTVLMISAVRDEHEMPDFNKLDKAYSVVHSLISDGKVLSAHTVKSGGVVEAVSKMCFGNRIGMQFQNVVDEKLLFSANIGSLVLEVCYGFDFSKTFSGIVFTKLGITSEKPCITVNGMEIGIAELQDHWEKPLEKVFPSKAPFTEAVMAADLYTSRSNVKPRVKFARPRVLISVFPGTNCEYDTERAFNKAGAECDIFVLKNIRPSDIEESIESMVKKIRGSQIVMIPGGFSAGDEPDGSGKFIAAFFRNPHIKDAIDDLLKNRDGLMLGICNGFQALVKLGLVPYGEIREMHEFSPTLTFNTIGRHISHMAYTRVCSVKSPWFSNVKPGDIHAMAVSHGEGRFVAPEKTIKELLINGQIATQYVDCDGNCCGPEANLNGSYYAIEGVCSPDGRVLGKMGHSERKGDHVAVNIHGCKDQLLFESGVSYYS